MHLNIAGIHAQNAQMASVWAAQGARSDAQHANALATGAATYATGNANFAAAAAIQAQVSSELPPSFWSNWSRAERRRWSRGP